MSATAQRLHAEHLARRARFFPAPPPPAIMTEEIVGIAPAETPVSDPDALEPAPVVALPEAVTSDDPPPTPFRDIIWIGSSAFASTQHFKYALGLVCKEFGVSQHDVVSERRTASVVLPRQILMYLMKETTTRSLPAIGRYLGGRDHTTILHGVRKVAGIVRSDPVMACRVAYMEAQLSQ